MGTTFARQVEALYSSPQRRTPYQITDNGRLILEKLGQFVELDSLENQKWLLWELMHEINAENGYKCSLRLSKGRPPAHGVKEVSVTVFDHWRATRFAIVANAAEEDESFWWHQFDCLKSELAEFKHSTVQPEIPRFLEKFGSSIDGNPYSSTRDSQRVYSFIGRELSTMGDGDKGSFLYDFQEVVMKGVGKSLEVMLAIGPFKGCYEESVDLDHSPTSENRLYTAIYDGFFRTSKYTCVCPNHWAHECEGGFNMLDQESEVFLGIA